MEEGVFSEVSTNRDERKDIHRGRETLIKRTNDGTTTLAVRDCPSWETDAYMLPHSQICVRPPPLPLFHSSVPEHDLIISSPTTHHHHRSSE